MADKDIRINIATEADVTGAKQTEQALDAVASSGDSIRDVLGDDIADQFAKLREETAGLKDEAAVLKEDLPSVAEATGEIATRQKLQAVTELADKIGEMGRKVEDTGRELREAGDEGGADFEKMGSGLAKVSSQVGTVAAGLAAGGPIGGAVAALSVLVESLFDAWSQGAIRAAREQQRVAEQVGESITAIRESRDAAREFREEMERDGIVQALDSQLRKLKDQTAELERQTDVAQKLRDLQNEALENEDRAALAQIDAGVASAKFTEEEGAKRRAEVETAARERADAERVRRVNEAAREEQTKLEEGLAAVERISAAVAEVEKRAAAAVEKQEASEKAARDAAAESVAARAKAEPFGFARHGAAYLLGDETKSPSVRAAEEAKARADFELSKVGPNQASAASELATLDELRKKLAEARQELGGQRARVDSSLTIARETANVVGRNQASRTVEGRALRETAAAPAERGEAAQIVGEVEKLAGGLSGVGNAAGNAKRTIEGAVQRVNADGQVLTRELPGLVAAVEGAMQSMTSRDDETRAALQEAVRRIRNLEGQIRARRDGK